MVAQPKPDFNQETPEWLRQRLLVQTGKATWDDFTFEERTCRGWLIPYLYEIETMFWGRWAYWAETVEAGKLLEEPIPHLPIAGDGDHQTRDTKKMLDKCLNAYCCHSVRLPDFLEWLLWGLGDKGQKERARIDEKVNEHWYRTFNLGLMIQYPHDYLGHMLAEERPGKWNNPNAFFATPHDVVEMMVRMLMERSKIEDGKDPREASVFDPCVGTGRMLMHASNYSLNLYGQDIDRVCVMGCKINGYLYMPWLVRSAPWMEPGGNHMRTGNSLEMMTRADAEPKGQLNLF